MSDYFTLGLALTLYQVMKATQAIQVHQIHRRTTPYQFWYLVFTFLLGAALVWLPLTQSLTAYIVLGYYAFIGALRILAWARPNSVVAEVLRIQQTGSLTPLEWINHENQLHAEEQVQLSR